VEEELERAHAQSRVHALAQIHASASSATPTLSPIELGVARRESLIPMTRTSITHTWDDDGVTARVHISPRQTGISPLTVNASGISSGTPVSAYPVPQAYSTYRSHPSFDTFVADPLPMPLVDMTHYSPTVYSPYPKTIAVHKYASLAGR
jgi:hypothetical protein